MRRSMGGNVQRTRCGALEERRLGRGGPSAAGGPLWLVLAVSGAWSCTSSTPATGVGAAQGRGGDGRESNSTSSTELAATPPMGFNNWNAFGCDVNEQLIIETADFFVSSGLKDAGYTYVNIDDCWSAQQRDANGRLVPDPVKFPSGIAGVADYVHSLGLKLGIYGDAGTATCAGYPGSLGTEDLDAQTWADWGVDYVKYDNCFNQSDGSREDFVNRYTAMQLALEKTGRPMVYSVCEWGQSQPWEWATEVGHLWRTTGDITDNWSSVRDIVAFNAPLAPYAGPGHWNDPDMLEVGNGGMSAIEYRTHMSLWAMMAAPLIAGTDLRVATPETLAILGNEQIIALDQDPLGVQATAVEQPNGLMVFHKPLASGEVAVALYNPTDEQAAVAAVAEQVGLAPAEAYHLQDLWSGEALEVKARIGAGVPAHGVRVFRTRPLSSGDSAAPAVSVSSSLPTLIAGASESTVLTTELLNLGVDSASAVQVSVEGPDGWAIVPTGSANVDALATDEAFETSWSVMIPATTLAGRYPLTVRTQYVWGEEGTPATAVTEVSAAVAVTPPDGLTPLSRLRPVTSSNGLGPVEVDRSNGGEAEGDGSLITLNGAVYTRGLGTQAPSTVTYYLGGQCDELTVDVGIDDEETQGLAAFQILADGEVVAETGMLSASDAPVTLTASLAGASQVALVTDPGLAPLGDHADWANPVVRCGDSGEVNFPERVLFSFEQGVGQFGIVNAAEGGSVQASTDFATDGGSGLSVTSPTDGNWFGQRFEQPLDLSDFTTLRYDVQTASIGTPGEFVVEVGPAATWCQGGLWTWTNANSSQTIVRRFEEIECPAGTEMDLTQIRGLYVYLKDGTFQIDNVRAE